MQVALLGSKIIHTHLCIYYIFFREQGSSSRAPNPADRGSACCLDPHRLVLRNSIISQQMGQDSHYPAKGTKVQAQPQEPGDH